MVTPSVELKAPLLLFETYSPFQPLNPIVDRTMSQTQMQKVGNGESSKKKYVTHFQDIIKLKGH